MQLYAASRPAQLQVIKVEEANPGHSDEGAPQIIESMLGRLTDERIQHVSRCGEPVVIWRCRVLAKIGVVGLDDQVITRIRSVRQH